MTAFDEERVTWLVDAATGSLNPASLWLVLTSVPEGKAAVKIDRQTAPRLQDWLRSAASTWPAPLKIGESQSEPPTDDRLVFSSVPNGGAIPGHYCELHADGACLAAVQIGTLKNAIDTPGKLWTIGEGSLAWLSICLTRLAAEWALQGDVVGPASLDFRLLSSAPQEDRSDLQLWSFASGTNRPASAPRQMTQPSRRLVDLGSCLSADVSLIARALLLPLLIQFGQRESRHIDGTGTLRSDNFVGHAHLINVWAATIGVACR